MKLMKKDIKATEEVTTFFALEAVQLKKSKKVQRYFLDLDLYDKSGRIKGYIWNEPATIAGTLKEKSFVKVRGIAKKMNNALILDVERIRTAEKHEVDMTDFLDIVPGGVEHWRKQLVDMAGTIKDRDCKRLIDALLSDEAFMELFLTLPAGITVHHNYIGGLLEHTVNSMMQAASIADKHSGLLNRDVLLTGAFLHDIGKTKEIYWEIAKEYTTEGKLLGHICIGLIMLEEKLAGLKDFPADLAVRLRHMIAAHHGTKEHGSPTLPATKEALVLHLIDNLDAKVNHLYCHLGNSDPNKEWSYFDRFLNTEIYQKGYAGRTLRAITEVAA